MGSFKMNVVHCCLCVYVSSENQGFTCGSVPSVWLQEMITEASFYLFNATKRRVFFRNIQILIPATWTAHNYSKVKQESYEKVRVLNSLKRA